MEIDRSEKKAEFNFDYLTIDFCILISSYSTLSIACCGYLLS